MGLKKETQNTVLKGMKQNKAKPLNAGEKREQIKSMVDSLLASPKSVKLEVIKLLVDSL